MKPQWRTNKRGDHYIKRKKVRSPVDSDAENAARRVRISENGVVDGSNNTTTRRVNTLFTMDKPIRGGKVLVEMDVDGKLFANGEPVVFIQSSGSLAYTAQVPLHRRPIGPDGKPVAGYRLNERELEILLLTEEQKALPDHDPDPIRAILDDRTRNAITPDAATKLKIIMALRKKAATL